MNNYIGYITYLMFTISWFCHLSARLPIMGIIRIDLILISIMIVIIILADKNSYLDKLIRSTNTNKLIIGIIAYIVISLPFVQWPGSVLKTGMVAFIKSIVFYYFTVYFISSESRLYNFVFVFIGCQTFRVIEPLYLHITEGYWGAFASMGTGGWDVMDRLSGAPHDVINPNGLAFVVLIIIPFYYFLSKISVIYNIGLVVVIPLAIYALMLTGSRSGFIGLIVILCGLFVKSANKVTIIIIIILVSIVIGNYINSNTIDRYKSIYSSNTKNSLTSAGRIDGIKNNLIVAMRRPIFGHGLGTSVEANANYLGEDKPSHNLYVEILQELGLIGLIIFLMLIKSIFNNIKDINAHIDAGNSSSDYINKLNAAIQVMIYMTTIFSFASYGLSSYEWYLIAGLSVAIKNIMLLNDKLCHEQHYE